MHPAGHRPFPGPYRPNPTFGVMENGEVVRLPPLPNPVMRSPVARGMTAGAVAGFVLGALAGHMQSDKLLKTKDDKVATTAIGATSGMVLGAGFGAGIVAIANR